jgi:hypothetical protein
MEFRNFFLKEVVAIVCVHGVAIGQAHFKQFPVSVRTSVLLLCSEQTTIPCPKSVEPSLCPHSKLYETRNIWLRNIRELCIVCKGMPWTFCVRHTAVFTWIMWFWLLHYRLDYTVSQLGIHSHVYMRGFCKLFCTVRKQCPPSSLCMKYGDIFI